MKPEIIELPDFWKIIFVLLVFAGSNSDHCEKYKLVKKSYRAKGCNYGQTY